MNLENPDYLHTQLITYIGNKRSLLPFIETGIQIVQNELGKEKLSTFDVFAGSGIVSRFLKGFSSSIVANDLEPYACQISRCYLSNLNDPAENRKLQELTKIYENFVEKVNRKISEWESNKEIQGFISELYAPESLTEIKKEDRCFYTPRNAAFLDIARQLIQTEIPEELQDYFIAPLLSEASIHANTAGIFKGFYKNSKTKTGQFGGNGNDALSRILGNIELKFPVFSNFSCPFKVFNCDANALVKNQELYLLPDGEFDLAYLDPPYNQHPYGSNYFMLNLLSSYKRPDEQKISRVSGIPKDWNRSIYNKKRYAKENFLDLVRNLKARYMLISFNSEGFISKEEMIELLNEIGTVQVLESSYNTFRGSRNLENRSIHVKEYLFLVKKTKG